MSRWLAIDFGLKRMGIAVTDPLRIIASPLETVDSVRILDWLKAYLAKEEVETIVLGKPLTVRNEPAEIAENVEIFAEELKKLFPGLNIAFVDERFTSKIAAQTIAQSGKGKKARQNKKLIDKVSASLILQTYMNTKMNTLK